VDVQIQVFMTSAIAGGEWSALRPGCFTSGERTPSSHWIGDWVGFTASLDDMEKGKFLTLLGLELRPLGRPTCSPSLLYYWQGVVGRTSRLLSFDTTRVAQKTMPPTVLLCRGNVFTEPLPGNDRGVKGHTQRPSFDAKRTASRPT
jgi:hypothetical protein